MTFCSKVLLSRRRNEFNPFCTKAATAALPWFQAQSVDFGRDASLSIALTGANKWDAAFAAVGAFG